MGLPQSAAIDALTTCPMIRSCTAHMGHADPDQNENRLTRFGQSHVQNAKEGKDLKF